jgi:hypothetical protein
MQTIFRNSLYRHSKKRCIYNNILGINSNIWDINSNFDIKTNINIINEFHVPIIKKFNPILGMYSVQAANLMSQFSEYHTKNSDFIFNKRGFYDESICIQTNFNIELLDFITLNKISDDSFTHSVQIIRSGLSAIEVVCE